ncbi:MAG: hypothetical protein ABIN25_04245 [Ginsengibacter sp.]
MVSCYYIMVRTMDPETEISALTMTVLIEGLVYFKKKWFLYYGCADSKIAVAVYDPFNAALQDKLAVSLK